MKFSVPNAIATASLLLAMGIVGCRHTDSPDAGASGEDAASTAPITVEMATAEMKRVETIVQAQGSLAFAQGFSAHLAAAAPGRVVAVRVREGDAVVKGELIALIDNRPQQAQERSAEAAVIAAQSLAREADLAANAASADQSSAERLARLALSGTRLDGDSAMQQAMTALQSAETDLAKTRAGARPQEIAEADQAVAQARVTRDRAVTELQRTQELLKIGVAAEKQLDDDQAARDLAQSALESAQQQDSLVRAGPRAEDVRVAELRAEGARELLAQTRKSSAAKVAQAAAALRQAQSAMLQVEVKRQDAVAMRDAVAQKRADYNSAAATAGFSNVRAPLNGIVTRCILNVGDMADTTTPIVEIGDPNTLDLIANLAAEDGRQLRAGLAARITSKGAPGRTFPGRVSSVGQIDMQTNLLAVRIELVGAGRALRSGSFATADIVAHVDPRAVVVPSDAVITLNGKTVVFTVGPDGTAHQQEVVLGPMEGGSVAIYGGVKPGMHVVKLGQYEMTDGAHVREEEHSGESTAAPAHPANDGGIDRGKESAQDNKG